MKCFLKKVGLVALVVSAQISQAHSKELVVGEVEGNRSQAFRPYANRSGNFWLSKIWSPLVTYAPQADGVSPMLAEKWIVKEEGRRFELVLRSDVLWHDGEKFSAEDVKYSFELGLHPEFSWNAEFGIGKNIVGAQDYREGKTTSIEGIRILDAHRIEFSLKDQDPRFLYKIATTYIIPKHLFAGKSPKELSSGKAFLETPVGTGPFKVASNSTELNQLVANKDYFGGSPKLDRLTRRTFTDEASARQALAQDEIQFFPVSQLLKSDSDFKVYSGNSYVNAGLSFNFRDSRFQDIRVRKAIRHAVDVDSLIQRYRRDVAQPSSCSFSMCKDPGLRSEYDLKQARQLLKEANWDDKAVLEIGSYSQDETSKEIVRALQAQLSLVGIQTRWVLVSPQDFHSYMAQGKWSFLYRGVGNLPQQTIRDWFSPNTQTFDKKSFIGLEDPKLQEKIDHADRVLSDQSFQSEKEKICQYLWSLAVDVPLWQELRFGLGSPRLLNFHWYPAPAQGPYLDHPELWDLK